MIALFEQELSHRMRTSRFCLPALLLGVGLAWGCNNVEGPTKYPISGTVTREGQPMREGIIQFAPTGGGPAAQTVIADGKYEFTEENGPVEGDHTVKILRVLERGPIPPGGVAKDADFLPETGFKSPMPEGGWIMKASVSADQDVSQPMDFNVDEAQAAAGGRGGGGLSKRK